MRESDMSLRFLVDQVNKDLRALASLDLPTDKWDILLIYMLSSKLDSQTLLKWEEYRNGLDDIPTLDLFNKFLNDRADVLESLNRNKIDNPMNKGSPSTSCSFVPNYNNYNKVSLNTNSIDAIRVVGIGDNALNNVIESCTVKLSSINSSYNLKLTCMVLDKIMGDISKSRINLKNLNLPQNLPLADPQFYSPGSIDLLIGSDMFWDIIGSKTRYIGDGKLKLRSSKFGWIVCGSLPSCHGNNKNHKSAQCNLALCKLSPNDIDVTILPKFWEIEDLPNASEPLYPLSSSPDDFLSLTPGHFLIGRALNALPSECLDSIKETNLRRYERLDKIRQHFWNRWQKEYVAELQQRTKWKTNLGKLKIGDLVLLQEDHVPPLNWRLGRVKGLFPGPDNISRVAESIRYEDVYDVHWFVSALL
ncbi:unnamed protein product [Euphydryas editha]|uniref:DUF5641 domain-containing protein n=1 Tax=Euphydryas editha TaxID=104508 RepID=A0AAU9VAQ5_EUPED|nr:unnamed protein product [Euphydryas editha]